MWEAVSGSEGCVGSCEWEGCVEAVSGSEGCVGSCEWE